MHIALILRTFTKRDVTTMRTLFIALVRPHLDYCSPLWSPGPSNYADIERLEGVLRSFTKQVDGLRNLDYAGRLGALNLKSVQRRHERYKIIYAFKMKAGLVPSLPTNITTPNISSALKFIKTRRQGTRCEVPNQCLHHNSAQTVRNSSFALTVSNLWNCLPPWISNYSGNSVDAFKNKLDHFLDIFPDTPRICSNGLYYDPNTGRKSNSIYHMRYHHSIRSKIETIRLCSVNVREGLIEEIHHP